ncbi:hypothetical protein BUALT_Bualt11G0025500 [Buddleja alternifolia]|uniref:Reverse transcriptase domain-containing protein n=1 Tax=Buddleja alternifolia TaxID=168488 RepID=A0AAV6X2N4_9LAMI|nr:hypothetical protein BUALT_Bualt11G0025500 [Buddleja alternifolia]
MMSELESPNQSSFIAVRNTHDNIIVVQEMVHGLKRMKNRKGGMIVKIDIEKAYDKVRWEFVEHLFFQFPKHTIELIMYCIHCSKPRVLWNGSPLQEFRMSCGLRQGYPLSPYLFVLCMERLAYSIKEAVSSKNWNPIPVCQGSSTFSHIFFADDFLLFARATRGNTATIKEVMNHFYKASGLVINRGKSKVFLPSVLGGGTDVVSPWSWVQARLSSWKAKLLNFVGRLTLVKSVMAALPVHTMQSTWLPQGTCNQLDRLNRAFLWATSANPKKLYLVKWEKVVKIKENAS